jgi:hypothetical protein
MNRHPDNVLNTEPFSGVFMHWTLLSYVNHQSKVDPQSLSIETICMGVLLSDTQERFANCRPIRTSLIHSFDLLNMSIKTQNSKYQLCGPGSFQTVPIHQLDARYQRIRKSISSVAKTMRENRFH